MNAHSKQPNKTEDKTHAYRPNVGIALFNQSGQVFMGRRLGINDKNYAWQLPQGGIDQGETDEQAALRELEEETGIKQCYIKKLGEIKDWLYYDFPEDFIKKNKHYNKKTLKNGPKYWLGQKQKWFAYRFMGENHHIQIDQKTPEFDQWRWSDFADIPDQVISWKKSVYQHILIKFSDFSHVP